MTSNNIITRENFLSPEECTALVAAIESFGFASQFAGDGRLIRSRAQFEEPTWAQLIWERLRPSIPALTEVYSEQFLPEPTPQLPLSQYMPVHLNERFRCYKYGPDEEFRRHQDFAHEYSATKRTFLTVLLYLNDGYSGGETAFDNWVVQPKLGQLVMFPHELEHEGCRILSGWKYTLRSDVVFEAAG